MPNDFRPESPRERRMRIFDNVMTVLTYTTILVCAIALGIGLGQ